MRLLTSINDIVYLAERKLIRIDKLSLLKGVRLGIDGTYWIRSLCRRDAYSIAMGGIPWSLEDAILKELKIFK